MFVLFVLFGFLRKYGFLFFLPLYPLCRLQNTLSSFLKLACQNSPGFFFFSLALPQFCLLLPWCIFCLNPSSRRHEGLFRLDPNHAQLRFASQSRHFWRRPRDFVVVRGDLTRELLDFSVCVYVRFFFWTCIFTLLNSTMQAR